MRISFVWPLAALIIITCTSAGLGKDSCAECHAELDGRLASPVDGMRTDIHSRQGLSCASCHGGDASLDDPSLAMSARRGFVGVPTADKIPSFCGNCHNNAEYMRKFSPSLRVDQLQLYWTSVHGKRLSGGDTHVAGCVSCHGVHGILPATDPRSPVYPSNVPSTCARCHSDTALMRRYGISTDQMEGYRTSVHGTALIEKGDLGAPACNDCHGNHGATPPGVASVANVCSQCHPANGELLAGSPHAAPFQEMGIAACESCHGNHGIKRPTDKMLGTANESVCLSCHDRDSTGYAVAAGMAGTIQSLVARRDEAAKLIHRAETAGMEVSTAKFDLHEVDGALTLARTTVHSFSLAKVEDVTSKGLALAEKVRLAGVAALDELQSRRKWLGVSLIITVVIAVGLLLRIKEIRRGKTAH